MEFKKKSGERFACLQCGNVDLVLEDGNAVHGKKIVCPECEDGYGNKRFVAWLAKEKNQDSRADKNAKWRNKWKEKSHGMKCAMCGVTETETAGGFECHHITPLQDGGSDIFENTIMLCKSCHTVWHSLRSKHEAIRKKVHHGVYELSVG